MVVIDVDRRRVVKGIDVGGRPVHIYNPHFGSEVWVHSDEEGTFYVIDSSHQMGLPQSSLGGASIAFHLFPAAGTLEVRQRNHVDAVGGRCR